MTDSIKPFLDWLIAGNTAGILVIVFAAGKLFQRIKNIEKYSNSSQVYRNSVIRIESECDDMREQLKILNGRLGKLQDNFFEQMTEISGKIGKLEGSTD